MDKNINEIYKHTSKTTTSLPPTTTSTTTCSPHRVDSNKVIEENKKRKFEFVRKFFGW